MQVCLTWCTCRPVAPQGFISSGLHGLCLWPEENRTGTLRRLTCHMTPWPRGAHIGEKCWHHHLPLGRLGNQVGSMTGMRTRQDSLNRGQGGVHLSRVRSVGWLLLQICATKLTTTQCFYSISANGVILFWNDNQYFLKFFNDPKYKLPHISWYLYLWNSLLL